MYISNPVKSWSIFYIIILLSTKLPNSNRAGQRYFKNSLTFPNYKARSDLYTYVSICKTNNFENAYVSTYYIVESLWGRSSVNKYLTNWIKSLSLEMIIRLKIMRDSQEKN